MTTSLRAAAAVFAAAVVLSAAGGVEDAYFAPDGPTLFKAVMPDGSSYRFEYDVARPGRLVSGFGWDGEFDVGGRVSLRSPSGASELVFDRGRLVCSRTGEKTERFAYDAPRSAPTNAVTPLAILLYDEEAVSRQYVSDEESVKWSGSGRLAFPYVNPNFSGALFAQLALLFFALALLPSLGRKSRAALWGLAAASGACVVWSGSRGALLGLAAGALVATAPFVRRKIAVWKVAAALGAVAAVAAVVVLALGEGNLLRGFSDGGLNWSNALRVEMAKAAPRMIADAPGGWSSFGIGRAFTYWYQPIGMVLMSGSLINSHLTLLAGFGIAGRFFYLFSLFVVLALSLRAAFCRRDPVPAAVAVGFSVMACFNPMFGEWGLWIVPALSLTPLLAALRGIGRRTVCLLLSVSAIASAAVLGALMLIGAADGTRPSVSYDGKRVRINGRNPRIWVVDDAQGVLGGVLVGREIRDFYMRNPKAPSIGYVRDVRDVPKSGVNRLVLPGKSGNDWLLMLSEDEKAREGLPKSVVFLNPPFSPSEMPQGVLALCHPKLLVGEFAARYNPEYASPPEWVGVVPGVEKYMPNWMQYALME